MHLTTLSNLSPAQQRRLRAKIRIEKEKRRRIQRKAEAAPPHWRGWLPTLFPRTFNKPFAPRQAEFWEWIEILRPGEKPDPSAFFAVWPRGSGKTTSAETAVSRVGAKETRKFVLYVRSTQDKANESVANIAALLESREIERYYPALASRKVGKYGNARGWRLDMLRCANGFNVLALGLDAAVRGVKLEDFRPDLIVFDDIDDEHDSAKTIKKKVDILTKSIIPAGASHCAYLGVQNVIHANSIFNQVIEGIADFLHDRHVSGPHPAVANLTYEARDGGGYIITGGTATWDGQPLDLCEKQMNEWGLSAFLREAQHEVDDAGGIWDHVVFRHCDWRELPDLITGEVWCDPAVTATDESDNNGIAAGGIDSSGNIYVTWSWESIDTPLNVIKRAILKCLELGFAAVGCETDQGGDTWRSVYYQAWRELLENDDYPFITTAAVVRSLDGWQDLLGDGASLDGVKDETAVFLYDDGWRPVRRPKFRSAKAGAGHGSKVERNQRMLTDYERGQVIHARGAHVAAEKALRRFPNKPLDLADALYWLWFHLQKRRKKSRIL
jgi:hypothetical protein